MCELVYRVLEVIDGVGQVDIVYTDFSEAFNKILVGIHGDLLRYYFLSSEQKSGSDETGLLFIIYFCFVWCTAGFSP